MKSLSKTSLKFASLAALVVFAATSASAQNPRIQITQLDVLAAKASQTVDVNIDEGLMQIAKNFLSNKDADEVKVKELVNGLKGIYVKSFEFETENQFSDADLESIRAQLRNSAWNRIVNVSSKKEGSVEVYVMHSGSQISGLALLAVDPKEVTVVNIIGPVDLEKLSELEGQFGIPELRIEHSKTKRKN